MAFKNKNEPIYSCLTLTSIFWCLEDIFWCLDDRIRWCKNYINIIHVASIKYWFKIYKTLLLILFSLWWERKMSANIGPRRDPKVTSSIWVQNLLFNVKYESLVVELKKLQQLIFDIPLTNTPRFRNTSFKQTSIVMLQSDGILLNKNFAPKWSIYWQLSCIKTSSTNDKECLMVHYVLYQINYRFCQTIGRNTNSWKNPFLRALFIFTDQKGVPALELAGINLSLVTSVFHYVITSLIQFGIRN